MTGTSLRREKIYFQLALFRYKRKGRERERKRVGTVVHKGWEAQESLSLPMGREYILNANIRELTLNNHVIFFYIPQPVFSHKQLYIDFF